MTTAAAPSAITDWSVRQTTSPSGASHGGGTITVTAPATGEVLTMPPRRRGHVRRHRHTRAVGVGGPHLRPECRGPP